MNAAKLKRQMKNSERGNIAMADDMRWDPWREVEGFRRAVDRVFDDFLRWPRLTWREGEATIPLDVYETDDALVVKAALPGVKPEDVDISITGDNLIIRGECTGKEEVKRESYHRQEIYYGTFSRSLAMPTRVDHEHAEAVFENGLLTITMPKAEEVKPKSIMVRTVLPSGP